MLRRHRRAAARLSHAPRRRPPAGMSLEALEPRAMLTAFNYAAGVLQLVIEEVDTALVVVATGSNGYSVSTNQTFKGTDIPGQLVGNGSSSLSITPALGLLTVVVTDAASNAALAFGTGSPGGTYDADFIVSLDDPGATAIGVTGATTFSGVHSLSASAARISIDAELASASGFITLDADSGTQTVGVPAGVAISAAGAVSTSGGAIDISGRGGDSIAGDQVGVTIQGTVKAGDDGSTFGTLTISGVGGLTTGEFGGNHGVVVDVGGTVSSSGGAMSITGAGAAVTGNEVGVVVAGLVQTASAAGHPGDITLEGFGGGSTATPGSSNNYGIRIDPTGQVVTAAGALSATGHEGIGNTLGFFPYTDSPGIWDDNGSVQSTSGELSFNADSFWADLAAGGAIATSSTVSFRNLTAGRTIGLDVDMNTILGAVVASRIVVGRDDLLPDIVQAAAPDGTLVLRAGTALDLVGSSISLQAPIVTPGARQNYRGAVHLGNVTPSDVTLTGSVVRFSSTVDGGGRSLAVIGGLETAAAVTGLMDLSVSGASSLAGDVTTTGQQLYGGPVTLNAPLVTLTSPTGSFGAGVVGGGHSLAIDFGGTTHIDGPSFTGIAALSCGNGGTTTIAGALSTSGTQSFGDGVTLVGDTTLGSGGGDIVFSGTLDGARNLSLAAGSGLIRFQSALGSAVPLASLSIASAWGVTASNTITIDGSATGAAPNGLVIAGVGHVDMQVPGSSVQHCAGSGILLLSSPGSSLGGFTIRDNAAYGIYVSGNTADSVIVANTVAGNTVGVYLAAAEGLTLGSGNMITGNALYGIYATGWAKRTTTITGNTIDGTGSGVYGVYLADAKNIHLGQTGAGNLITGSRIGVQAVGGLLSTTLTDNRVEGNGSGIVLVDARHATVSGDNRITGNTSYGLLARGTFLDTTVSGATLSGNFVGLCLFGAKGLAVNGGTTVGGSTVYAMCASGDCSSSTVTGSTFLGNGSGTVGVFLDGATGLAVGSTSPGAGNVVGGGAVGIQTRGTLTGTTVRGNTVEGNGSGIVLDGAVGLAVDGGNTIRHATSYGILVKGDCNGSFFTNNAIDSNAAGVVLSSARGVTIDGGNAIRGSTSYGVYVGGDSLGSRVIGNAIDGLGTGFCGIYLDAATGAIIGDGGAGNTLVGCANGIYARGPLDGTVVRSNTVTGGTAGTVLYGATNLTVEAGNRFTGASGYGILAQGACTGSVIAANTVDGNTDGIWLAAATGLDVRGANEILGNTNHGIFATGDATGTRIVGNVINGSGITTHGVFLDGVTGLTLGSAAAGEINTVTSNTVGIYARGSLQGTSVVANIVAGNHSGLVMGDAKGLAVNGGNHFIGMSDFGIYGTGDCDGTVIEGNQIESNSSGVVLEDAKRLRVVNNNRMISNAAFGLYAKGDSTGTVVLGNEIQGNGQNVEVSAAIGGIFQTA